MTTQISRIFQVVALGFSLCSTAQADVSSLRQIENKLMGTLSQAPGMSIDLERIDAYELDMNTVKVWINRGTSHELIRFQCDASPHNQPFCDLMDQTSVRLVTPQNRMLFIEFGIAMDQLPIELLRIQERLGMSDLAQKTTSIKLWKEPAMIRLRVTTSDRTIFLQCHNEAHEGVIGGHCHYRGSAGTFEPIEKIQ